MCGVFGIRAPGRDVARLSYFGIYALQHRGQESAGIAVSDGGRVTALRDLGLVAQVFSEGSLRGLHGDVAIGHNRYSTTGANAWANAQPLVHHGHARTVALGHNGNLVNAAELREDVGKPLASTSDSEVIAVLVADDPRPLDEAVAATMDRLEGAATVVGLAEGKLFAFRDRHGFRPLVYGRLGDDPVVASETCALDLVGATLERELEPGELLLTTLRSHDQFNTTIYGENDRYRGIFGGRRVLFINEQDIAERGLTAGAFVDLISRFGREQRRAERFRLVPYAIPCGSVAAYYPEANVLVPLESVSEGSNQPAFKSVVIRIEQSLTPGAALQASVS